MDAIVSVAREHFIPHRAVNLDIKERKSVVKVGINFLFGGGSAPVAARY